MNTTTTTTFDEDTLNRLIGYKDSGATLKKAKAFLTLEDIVSPVIVKAYLTAAGFEEGVTGKRGFNAEYNEFLVSERRTKEEAIAFINEVGSPNVIRHLSKHLLTYNLAIKLYDKFEAIIKESEVLEPIKAPKKKAKKAA